MKAEQCFGCKKFAKAEDCVLLRHRISGIRRWFHKRVPGASDCAGLFKQKNKYWEEISSLLGSTTIEEERRLIRGPR